MEIGTPLPPDLSAIHAAAVLGQHSAEDRKALFARLHAIHHGYNSDHDALYDKQKLIRATLDELYKNERQANLAGFNLVLKPGKFRVTLDMAKELFDRVKNVLDSGKDEE